MSYIGPAPNPGQNREVDDISSGFNGSEVNFTLQVNSQNVSPGSPNNIIVSLGGVVQNPSTDYNIAASTITFTTAPANGLSFFGLVLGQQVDIQSLADGASPTMSAPSITGDLSIADKIIHTGDTNTAIRFPAADTITTETGGSERVRVDSSGNVGIGTSSPTVNVQVQSSGTNSLLKLAGTSAGSGINDGLDVGINGVDAILWNRENGSTQFATNNTERMRIASNGNVTMPHQACMVFTNPVNVTDPSENTPLQFSGLDVSKGGMAESNSRSRITVPTTGVYLISALISGSVVTASSTDGIEFHLRKNGSVFPSSDTFPITTYGSTAGDEYYVDFTVILNLSANDYLEVALTNLDASQGDISRGYFAVALIS